METRPKIEIKLTPRDKLLELSGWMLFAFLWVLTLYSYVSIHGDIPTHFNALGQADNFGNKTTIFLLPILGTIIFTGLTALNKYPQKFNYIRFSKEKALNQYTYATKMIRSVKTGIIFIFSLIILFTYLTATGKMHGFGIWFLPFTLIVLLGPSAYYITKSLKAD